MDIRFHLQHQHDWVSLDYDKPAALPAPNPTRSFWAHSSPSANPLANEGNTGPLTTDADICIIGSGITGIGVAYHLAEASAISTDIQSLKVVILEAREFCTGATGRNGGHLTPAVLSGFEDRVNKYGPEEAKRSYALEVYTASSLVRIVQQHGWTDDVDLVQGGHITLLFTNDEIDEVRRDREAAVRAGWSLDGVEDLSRDEVEATFGAPYPAVKIPGYNVWPLKLVTKLFQYAKSCLDIALHTHTPVTAIQHVGANGRRQYAVSTPRGTVTCTRVIHATNGYASHLLPMLAGPRGIVPVRGQIIATRACVNANAIRTSSWDADEGNKYWFPRPVKTHEDAQAPLVILGGGRHSAEPEYEAFVDDDSTCHPAVGRTLRAFLPQVFRGKFQRGQEPEMEWTGIMGYTETKYPFVGPVDGLVTMQNKGDNPTWYIGQYVAAGYTGHGMPRAFACAQVVAEMIIAELTSRTWIQPDWFPTRYLTWEPRGTTHA